MSDRLAFLCKVLRGYAVEVTVRAKPPPPRQSSPPPPAKKTQHVPTETDVALPIPITPASSPPAPSTRASSAPMRPPTIR